MATMAGHVVYIGYLLIIISGVQGQDDKRLLLHSDDDLVQAVQTLTAKVQSLETTAAKMSQVDTIVAQMSQLETTVAKMSQLETTVATLQNTIGVGGGSSYVRWGKTACPANGTTTLYSGYTASTTYSDKGGGANTLCLPPDPQWDHYEDTVASGGRIYGSEYDIGWKHPGTESNFFGKNVRNEDVPCAVCYSDRPSMIMIPARKDCYPGWTKEYGGYLMSGYYDHPSPAEYICVDKAVDVLVGGHAYQNGRLLYLVEGICGSLKCPPYINGRELTCCLYKINGPNVLLVDLMSLLCPLSKKRGHNGLHLSAARYVCPSVRNLFVSDQ